MDFSQVFNIFFKIFAVVMALIYLLLSFVLSKQVRIMVNTLKDNFNILIIFISSLQVTVALILLIFAIFFA